MRCHAVALAGMVGVAFAARAPAAASEASFFVEQHRSYFERGDRAAAAPPPAPSEPARRTGARTVALASPADAPPAGQAPNFSRGHLVPGGDEQLGTRGAAAIPREIVAFDGPESPGTIVVSTGEKRLYFVLPDHQAIRYGVGVGRPGFEWSGGQTITAKREWPDWTPPPEMIKRRPELPRHMAGGIENPLGARALYLGRSEYRIHGSNEPDTIGQAVSSGCIRMTNDDVADLYDRAEVGAKVLVER